jgi:cell division inhibitor SepF
MVKDLFKRAKAFIGFEEDENAEKDIAQQLDMSTILKGRRGVKGEGSYEIMFYEPKVYEDSLNISTHLRSGSPVIINLRHLDPAEGTRLIDFVCGAAYAIDGHMMKIGESLFLFTPNNIAIITADDKASFSEEINFEHEKRDAFFSR